MSNYQKLYSYLVGQVDHTLQIIAENLMHGTTGRDALITIGETLKNALLTAEDMYLEETEEN